MNKNKNLAIKEKKLVWGETGVFGGYRTLGGDSPAVDCRCNDYCSNNYHLTPHSTRLGPPNAMVIGRSRTSDNQCYVKHIHYRTMPGLTSSLWVALPYESL